VFTICTTSLTFTYSTFYPHSVFVCFVWIGEQTAIISLYCINCLVFITETVCVYCEVRTEYLYIIQVPLKPSGNQKYPQLTFTYSTFCPHSVFMCFVWIWEQTAIISIYSINWLVFITEMECVYCEVRTESLYKCHSYCTSCTTESPIQWVPGLLPGDKAAGVWRWPPTPHLEPG